MNIRLKTSTILETQNTCPAKLFKRQGVCCHVIIRSITAYHFTAIIVTQ